jgi:hypothetical protein
MALDLSFNNHGVTKKQPHLIASFVLIEYLAETPSPGVRFVTEMLEKLGPSHVFLGKLLNLKKFAKVIGQLHPEYNVQIAAVSFCGSRGSVSPFVNSPGPDPFYRILSTPGSSFKLCSYPPRSIIIRNSILAPSTNRRTG